MIAASGEQSASSMRSSFTYQTWQRLKNLCRALRQTEEKVRDLKSEAECKLKSTERMREKRAELQACRMSVSALETQLEWRRANARTAAARLTQTRHRAAEHHVRMEHFSSELEELRAELAEKQRLYIGVREKLIWSAAQLFMRRRQMIQELRDIFIVEMLSPMIPVSSGRSTSSTGCICKAPMKIVNVHLPDAEDYKGHNDVELSVGLSYVAQALITISRIFNCPLLYRFEFFGSRSNVCDLINPTLQSNQRIFPLHSRNQDKSAFQYGVLLLNKNIAQLRCDCGTITQDLRCTLANLSSLINHLSDAKIEPYLYITRPVRLANEDGTSASSASYRRQSPSASSGAPSTDSGDRAAFHLEIPAHRLSSIENGAIDSRVSQTLDGERNCESRSTAEKPVNSSSRMAHHPSNDLIIPNLSSVAEDAFAQSCDEDTNGRVATIVDKDLLRTCYLSLDDDDQLSQPDQCHENVRQNGGCQSNLDRYLTPSDCGPSH